MGIRSTILAVMIFRHMVPVSLEVANALFQLRQPFFLFLCVSMLPQFRGHLTQFCIFFWRAPPLLNPSPPNTINLCEMGVKIQFSF
jgi:hypothetical protein